MTEINWDLLQPLRVAKGSHKAGSGKGCAMNVVSYITGESTITDYPKCSHGVLSQMVQRMNDSLAGSDGYLSPERALAVIELGCLTIGTGFGGMKLRHQYEIERKFLTALLNDRKWGACLLGVEDNLLSSEGNSVDDYFLSQISFVSQMRFHARGLGMEYTRWAIQTFREIAGLSPDVEINSHAIELATVGK